MKNKILILCIILGLTASSCSSETTEKEQLETKTPTNKAIEKNNEDNKNVSNDVEKNSDSNEKQEQQITKNENSEPNEFDGGIFKYKFLEGSVASSTLSVSDDYIDNLSKFDCNAKFDCEYIANTDYAYNIYAKTVMNWTEEEKKSVTKAIELINEKAKDCKFNMPKTVSFIKTKGLVEGGASYTRGQTIILSSELFSVEQDFLNKIVAHELFHVYSRYNEKHREKLYTPLKFKRVKNFSLPDSLKDLKISNPDATDLNYYITLEHNGEQKNFITVIFSQAPFNKDKNLNFFDYLTVKLLNVDIKGDTAKPITVNGESVLVDIDKTNFMKQVKANTNYVIHPEEISAENFSLWVTTKDINASTQGGFKIKHPDVITSLIEIMKTIK